MKDNLFKCILANEFNDTQENVNWLVKNDYITYTGTPLSKLEKYPAEYYYRPKVDFKWTGNTQGTENKQHHFILSEHLYEE